MRSRIALLSTLMVLALPAAAAAPITDECTGLVVVSLTVASHTTNCGTDCSGVLLVFGVTIGGQGGTCQDCDDNVANVGFAILGNNDMCSTSGTDLIRSLP